MGLLGIWYHGLLHGIRWLVMSYIINLMNNTLDISAQLQKKWPKISDLHQQQSMGNHALHLPVCGGELHYFSEGIIGRIERSVNT